MIEAEERRLQDRKEAVKRKEEEDAKKSTEKHKQKQEAA